MISLVRYIIVVYIFVLSLLSSCKDYSVEGIKFFDDMIASAVSATNSFNLPHKQTLITVTS